MSDSLCVVMPVYNERAAIGGVLKKWAAALDKLRIDYVIRPYNDGSKDDSLSVMRKAAESLRRVEVRDKPNGGHGPTILQGYREAAADGFDWAFQIDSDDEMGPEKFGELWSRRKDFDFIVGRRHGRAQALPRKIVSFVSRLAVRVFYGKGKVWDVNAPYRLMRVETFRESFAKIPADTFAPNVIITGIAARSSLRVCEIDVPQHDRTTGEVSIKKWKLLKAAVRSLWQTVFFAERCDGFPRVWASIAALLSLAASTVGGRSLWIDEIMRCLVQKKYSIDQLLACQHLSDFDSQSPIGYILWRPVQSLLGIEFGGFVLSAISAAIITYVAIAVVRRWKGAATSLLAGAVIALNPLLIYYGGELWFYGPWAAAFAIAFLAALEGRPWKLAIAGLFFVSFHFAGLFVWFVFAAVCTCVLWKTRGFTRSLKSSLFFAAPALICLPLYLKAQFAAAHLDSQGAQFSRLATVPSFLWRYFVQIFPSLSGGWWFGVALMAAGLVFLWLSRRRAESVVALAVVFGWILYTPYTHLRAYPFVVGRFWLFALAATLPLVAYGCDRIADKLKGGFVFGVLLLIADLIGSLAVLQMDGRTQPMRRFADEIAARADSVVFPNSYDIRPFRLSYPIPNGAVMLVPSQWEQGEAVRERGLRMIRSVSPLTPAFVGGNGTVELAERCGWTSSNRVTEIRTTVQRLAIKAHLFPEPNNISLKTDNQIIFPQESELTAAADTDNKPFFLPGDGWRLASMPPKKSDQPFTPLLMLAAGKSAELKVYVPKTFAGNSVVLSGYLGRGRSAAERYSVKLDIAQKGGYVSTQINGGEDGCYFLYPEVR